MGKIKSTVEDKISEHYNIRVPSTEYKIIIGMTFEYNENEVIEKIKKNRILIWLTLISNL